MSFKSFSDRVATMELQTSENTIWAFILVYAPTEKYSQEEMELFYQTVESALEYINTKNVTLLGDWNAQVGKTQRGEELVLGKYSYGDRSPHGQRLVEFAQEHNCKIMNSMFKKKYNKKWTWQSPNGKYFNEIDYILTNKPKQVQSFDIIQNLNFSTDHRMIRCRLIVQIKLNRKNFKSMKYTRDLPTVTGNTAEHWESKFNEAIKKEDGIQNKYNSLLNEFQDLLKQLPKCKDKTQKYISEETEYLLQKRKTLYKQKRTKENKIEITRVSKQICKNITKEKKIKRKETFEKFIIQSGALRKAYKSLNDKIEWTANLKNKWGKTLSRRPDILNEATKFYKDLYSNTEPIPQHYNEDHSQDISSGESPEKLLCSEIAHAIKTQKNNKATGSDNIANEVLKSLSSSLQKPLQLLFDNIMETETMPEQWSKSTIILIHKKGNRWDLSNYRPISLMSNLYKIFSKVMLNRLTAILDINQPREQAGFRKKFSTVDHIQVVTQMIEKANEYGKPLYMCFIDYTKAFDSLYHSSIWSALTEQGLNKKYVNLFRNLYSNCQASVKLEREGKDFNIDKGVRQGDPISPKIFSAVLESVFRCLKWEEKGIKVDGEFLSHLRFADDIVVFSETAQDLEAMIRELSIESKKVGLKMNTAKTKILTNREQIGILVDNNTIEYVDEYVYLGQLVSFNDCTEKEVQRRITLAWKKYWALKEIMKNKNIKISIKRKVYESSILPCLTYACQTWSLRKKDEEKIAICQRKMERSMLNVRKADKISNQKIRAKTKLPDVTESIRRLKWNWAGHICRLENSRWTKKVTEWTPRDGKRKQGRPKKRWRDIFNERVGSNWMTKARQREEWRKLGEAYAGEATSTDNN